MIGGGQPLSPSPISCANSFRANSLSVGSGTSSSRRRLAKETGRRKESEVSQLVLLRGRREIGVGVVATSDERGRSSLDGAADFIRPLSSTARNICLRLRLFVGHFCSAFCVAATRPVTRWNTTRSPVPLYSLFSRKRGTRVIHAHANARNVTFEPSLGAGKKASRLSEICQITFLDDPIK